MKRSQLKKAIADVSMPLITSDMEVHPILRRITAITERAMARFRQDLEAMYSNRMLTDQQRSSGWDKAYRRRESAMAKTKPLNARFEREVMIPLFVRSGVLKPHALNKTLSAR